MKHLLRLIALALLSLPAYAGKVDFAADGTCRVDGKPFFPIGIWIYGLDTDVMADLHEHRFNTVVGNSVSPSHLPLLEKHGMMAIPMASDEWLKLTDSPSLLAWYLIDEPEGRGTTPAEVQKLYDDLKSKDKDHPIGITHCQLDGPPRYKGMSDFTMTDVYPVDRERKWPLNAVGMYTANPRTVHNNPGWPNFTFIQTFGGPETDGGIWAQPLPHEVRFMAFNALVHRANGILYFSYWPRAPITWASVATLNRDIERLVPWLLARGEERTVTSSDPAVEVRAKKVGDAGWMVIATNNQPRTIRTTFKVDGMADATLTMPFVHARTVNAKAGQWPERFSAYEEKVYLVGPEPEMP